MEKGTIEPKGRVFTELELKHIAPGFNLREPGVMSIYGRSRAARSGTTIRWVVRYRASGFVHPRDYPIGIWPKVGMKEIRAARDRAALQISQGVDPKAEKEAAKLERQRRLIEEREAAEARARAEEAAKEDELTFDELFSKWLSDGVNRKNDNAELKDRYGNHIKKIIGDIEVRKLSESDLLGLLRPIVARGNDRTAELVYQNIRSALAWADERQPWRRLLIEGNPSKLIDIGKILSPDYTGVSTRWLRPNEISLLDSQLHSVRTNYSNLPAGKKYSGIRPIPKTIEISIWIMLLTMCRVGELSIAEWRHINWEHHTWFIPRENVKPTQGGAHTEHTVFLSPLAVKVFRALYSLTGHTPWLFPGGRKKDGTRSHIGEKEIGKKVKDRQKKFIDGEGKTRRPQDNTLVIGDESWSPHDLRRTGVTFMQHLKVPRDVRKACQNHAVSHGVDRHYEMYGYTEEMKEAWEKLGVFVEPLIPHASEFFNEVANHLEKV